MSDLLQDFYKRVGKIKTLNHNELTNLFIEYRKTKDPKIKEQIVNANLKLAFRFVKKYYNTNVPLEDLLQSACMGLITAVDKYDYRKGYKFSTYATFWLMSYVQKSFAHEARNIKIPMATQNRIYKLIKAIEKLEDKQEELDNTVLAHMTGLTVEQVSYYRGVQELVYMDSLDQATDSMAADYYQPMGQEDVELVDDSIYLQLYEAFKDAPTRFVATLDARTDFIDYLLKKGSSDSLAITQLFDLKNRVYSLNQRPKSFKPHEKLYAYFTLQKFSSALQLVIVMIKLLLSSKNLYDHISFMGLTQLYSTLKKEGKADISAIKGLAALQFVVYPLHAALAWPLRS